MSGDESKMDVEVLHAPSETSEFQAMDDWDAEQMLAEIEGVIGTADFFYSFKQGGRDVGGLSWKGVKAIVQAMTDSGYSFAIELMDKTVMDGRIEVMCSVTRTAPNGTTLAMMGVSSEKSGEAFCLQKAMSKAQRNAYRAVIPEHVLVDSLKAFLRDGKGSQRQLNSGGGSGGRSQRKPSAKELPPPPPPSKSGSSDSPSSKSSTEPSTRKASKPSSNGAAIAFLTKLTDGDWGAGETLLKARQASSEDRIQKLFGPDLLDRTEARLTRVSQEVGEEINLAGFQEVLMALHFQAVGMEENDSPVLELALRKKMSVAVGLLLVEDEDWSSDWSKANSGAAVLSLIKEARGEG